MDLLREYIRQLLKENKGVQYEETLVYALQARSGRDYGIEVAGNAGNDNTVSDLGFSVQGIDVAAEVKLNEDDFLGSFPKDAFAELSWNNSPPSFDGSVDSSHKQAATAAIFLNVLKGLKPDSQAHKVMMGIYDKIKDFKPTPWDLKSGFGSAKPSDASTPEEMDSKDRKTYIAMRNEPQLADLESEIADLESKLSSSSGPEAKKLEKKIKSMKSKAEKSSRFQGPKDSMVTSKQLTSGNSIVVSSDQINRVISSKVGPNGAATNYIIIGNGDPDSVSGRIWSLKGDPLGIGAPMFNAQPALQIRFRGSGGGKSARSYNLDFGTKVSHTKQDAQALKMDASAWTTDYTPASGGLRFNSAEELKDILTSGAKMSLDREADRKSRRKYMSSDSRRRIDAGKITEALLRDLIREALRTEAFTKTDERAIEVMARKEIDKKWKDHEKKIDKMFDERDKTLFRNDAFYKVIARIYQELQRAYAEDQFKYATRYTRKDIPLARFRPS